ncbi:MAG: YgfZ/GcvT domain-containing protein [Acidimicrobiia bacterium]
MQPGLAPAPEVVWFRGADAIKFLNDLISQEIGKLPPGSVARSLLLGPQGKLQFILWVLRGDDEVGLVTEDGRGDELVEALTRYRIRVDVEIAKEERDICLVVGERTDAPGTWTAEGDAVVADLSWDTVARTLQIGETAPDLAHLSADDYTLARIEAGMPLMGVDVDENTIPQETGLVAGSISFDKGCFLGQELVARLDSRGGRVNRHLRILQLDSPVAAGAALSADGKGVGTVTSVSGLRGLALVWREVEPGARVDAEGVGATVQRIPQKSEPAFTGS